MNTNRVPINHEILLINPPLYPEDIRQEPHASRHKHEHAMNYGLLVIGSLLHNLGYNVRIVDLYAHDIRQMISYVKKIFETTNTRYPIILISNISSYSLIPSLIIARMAKEFVPWPPLVCLGGQNATLDHLRILKILGSVDCIVLGEGEDTVKFLVASALQKANEFLQKEFTDKVITSTLKRVYNELRSISFRLNGRMYLGTSKSVDNLNNDLIYPLKYELYPGWKYYFPLVEESRGCPFACKFCANLVFSKRRYRVKKTKLFVKEIEHIIELWGQEDLPVVIMTSNYGLIPDVTKQSLELLRNKGISSIRFLAAMRVDAPWSNYIDLMSKYFDQVHFGLESGDKYILTIMNKTNNPSIYLDKARKAFKEFHKRGVHVAVNIIVGYIGETPTTLRNTIRFLLENERYIDSLWGGILVAYPGTPFRAEISKYHKIFQTKLVATPWSKAINTYLVKPSYHFTIEQLILLSLMLLKMFNNENNYYHHYKWYFQLKYRGGKLSFPSKMEVLKALIENVEEVGIEINNETFLKLFSHKSYKEVDKP